MQFIICAALLLGIYTPGHETCKTTITVVNCSGNPVEDAKVSIKKCSDKKTVELRTDADGSVKFEICEDNICSISVVAKIETSEVKGVKQNCSGSKSDYRCLFKLCGP